MFALYIRGWNVHELAQHYGINVRSVYEELKHTREEIRTMMAERYSEFVRDRVIPSAESIALEAEAVIQDLWKKSTDAKSGTLALIAIPEKRKQLFETLQLIGALPTKKESNQPRVDVKIIMEGRRVNTRKHARENIKA